MSVPTAAERKVVVDAGIVIRGERFDRFGSEFFTTPEVFAEIRDAQARRNLTQLPVVLQTRQPEQKDFAFVKAFAKETGDLGALSTNDMGLMALAVTLHREGGDIGGLLRSKPEIAGVLKQAVPFSWAPTNCSSAGNSVAGDASSRPSVGGSVREFELEPAFGGNWEDDSESEGGLEGIAEENEGDAAADGCCGAEEEAKLADSLAATSLEERTPEKKTNVASEEGEKNEESTAPRTSGKNTNTNTTPAEDRSAEPSNKILCAAFNHSTVVRDENAEDDESDMSDDEGWVTVENLRRLNNVIDKDDAEDVELPGVVAIASTDYSVQNVSIQMGLKALSCDGFRIRNVKMWGKICRACFHSTRETEKIFCPKCGNATLDRVPITLDNEGRMIVHDGRRRKTNLRGTIYNIPKYKGGHGRGTKNIMLSEDELYIGGRDRQIKYQQKLAEKQRAINDPFANEAVDAWCGRHVTGTGRTVNANPHQVQHGYGRKNPNANNFKKGKFKKK